MDALAGWHLAAIALIVLTWLMPVVVVGGVIAVVVTLRRSRSRR